MCLQVGRVFKTPSVGILKIGRLFKTPCISFSAGRLFTTPVIGVEKLYSRLFRTPCYTTYLLNSFVNPVPVDISELVIAVSGVDGGSGGSGDNGSSEPGPGGGFSGSGGTSGGSILYETPPVYSDTIWNATFVTNNQGSELPQITPEVIPTFFVNGVDISEFLTSLQIKRTLGGKSSYTATFIQTEAAYPGIPELIYKIRKDPGDLNPLFRGKNTYAEKIISHKFDLTRQVQITLSVGKAGQNKDVWNAPLMAPGTSKFDGYELTWSGEDMSCIFEQENQTMTDIVPSDPIKKSAWQCIQEICALKMLSNTKLMFPDYDVRQLRRQGNRPIDWMDQLALIYQAQRFWEGYTLYYITPSDPATSKSPVKFKLVDTINISKEDVIIEFMDDWKNEFTVSRAKDVAGIYGSQTCGPGTECPGHTGSITFSQPLNSVVLVITLYGDCHLQDFVFFNGPTLLAGGEGGGPPLYTGATPATHVEFNCVPNYSGGVNYYIGNGAGISQSGNAAYAVNMVGYKVFARGNTVGGTFDENFNFAVTDPVSILHWGERPEYTRIVNEIIPTAKVAQDYANALLAENIRKIFKASVQLPINLINPHISPGDLIEMTDYLTGQESVRWLVQEVDINWDGRKWIQKLEMFRGII